MGCSYAHAGLTYIYDTFDNKDTQPIRRPPPNLKIFFFENFFLIIFMLSPAP